MTVPPTPGTATRLLRAWRGGDRGALDALVPVVYDELSRLAHRALQRERDGHTLQTRALVHEVYLRLIDAEVAWQDGVHFMAVAAQTMRRLLVDHARSRLRQKRGGGGVRVDLAEVDVPMPEPPVDVLAVHDALERLASFDPRKSEILALHYFGGMNYDETAEAVGVSAATVDRELRLAKAWLKRDLGPAA